MVWSSYGFRVTLLWLTLVVGCGPHQRFEAEDSELDGVIGKRPFAPLLDYSRSVADDALLAKVFSRQWFEKFGRHRGAALSPRDQLKKDLVRVIDENQGIPPDAVHRVLRLMVDERSTLCAGVSCARVFGFGKKDVSRLMDETAKAVETSETLAAPEQTARRSRILASLLPDINQKLRAQMAKVFPSRPQVRSGVEGSCLAPALAVFGLRSHPNPDYNLKSPWKDKQNIDFRSSSAFKQNQGNTGSCHLFAFAEILRTTPVESVRHLRDLDIERTFVEVWAKRRGRNLEAALVNEVLEIRDLAERVRQSVQEAISRGEFRKKVFATWDKHLSYSWRMADHASNASLDLVHLREYGAVTRSSGLPRLTIAQVEALTDTVMDARMALIRRMVVEQKQVTDEDIRRTMLQPFRDLFRVAQESTDSQRAAIRNEARTLEFASVEFRQGDMRESIDRFMDIFATTGPLYISSGSHATAVVGYDAKKKVFYIRDSDDTRKRVYAQVDWDEFFNNLTHYGTVFKAFPSQYSLEKLGLTNEAASIKLAAP